MKDGKQRSKLSRRAELWTYALFVIGLTLAGLGVYFVAGSTGELLVFAGIAVIVASLVAAAIAWPWILLP